MKFEGGQVLKTNHIPTSRHRFLFKVEALLPYSGSLFFNIFYPANTSRFSAKRSSIFFFRAILLLLEIIGVIKR